MSDAVEAFLREFFGAGNTIPLASVKSPETQAADWLSPWLADLSRPDRPPVLLPRRRSAQAPLEIYALAFSDEQARTLGEELNAFVGPVDTNLDRRPASLDDVDPVEAAVAAFTGGRAFRFTILADTEIPEQRPRARAVLDRIELMRDVWQRRPLIESDTEVSTARLLGRVDLALRRGDPDVADEIVNRLAEEARLTARNLLFLRIRLLAASEAWARLLAMDQVAALLHVPRPVAVNEALIRAVYNVELAGFEPADPEGALEHFRDAVLPRYASLYGVRGPTVDAELAKSFLLAAAARNPPDDDLRDQILSEVSVPVRDEYIDQLARLIPTRARPEETPAHWKNIAVASYREERYDDALAAALAWEPSNEDEPLHRLRLIIDAAWSSDTLAAADLALDAVSDVSTELLEDLRSRPTHAMRLDELSTRRAAPVGVPSGWNSWVDQLDDGGHGARLLDVARRGSLEWDIASFTAESARMLTDRLGRTREQDVQRVLLAAVPSLLSFLDRVELPATAVRPLYQTLLSLLTFDPAQGTEERAALLDVVEWLLEQGLTVDDYGEVIDHIDYVWGRISARATLDFALDALDLLAANQAADDTARRAFGTRVLAFMGTPGRQIEPYQWAVFGLQAVDLGLTREYEGVRPADEDSEPLTDESERSRLSNKLIGAYSLESSALGRLKALIEDAYDAVDVRVNSDHVATDALLHLASEADIMLVATRSAKHAATNAIKRERDRKQLPTLVAAGKGTASLWRRLQDYLSER